MDGIRLIRKRSPTSLLCATFTLPCLNNLTADDRVLDWCKEIKLIACPIMSMQSHDFWLIEFPALYCILQHLYSYFTLFMFSPHQPRIVWVWPQHSPSCYGLFWVMSATASVMFLTLWIRASLAYSAMKFRPDQNCQVCCLVQNLLFFINLLRPKGYSCCSRYI